MALLNFLPLWIGAQSRGHLPCARARLTVAVLTGCCLFLLMLVATCGAVWRRRADRLAWRCSALLSSAGLPERGASCQFGVAFAASARQRLTVYRVQLKRRARALIGLPARASVPSSRRCDGVSESTMLQRVDAGLLSGGKTIVFIILQHIHSHAWALWLCA